MRLDICASGGLFTTGSLLHPRGFREALRMIFGRIHHLHIRDETSAPVV